MAAFVKLSAVLLLLLIAASQLNGIHCEQFDIWGDLGFTQLIVQRQSDVKWRIPFLRRTTEITYPDVSYSLLVSIISLEFRIFFQFF